MRAIFLISLTSILLGCVSTSTVLPVGKDTYTVSATADGFRTAAAAQESAYQAGMKKCHELSKNFMFVSSSTAPTRMGIDTTVSLNFMCLNENDRAYTRPNIQPTPDITFEQK